MKALLLPDIHLKPEMIEKAGELMRSGKYEICILLGDIPDDWEEGSNLALYAKTYRTLISFVKEFPGRVRLCWGNHDLSYRFLRSESGFSDYAVYTVRDGMKELEKSFESAEQVGYVHRIDRTIFSHAGLTESFVRKWFGEAFVMNWNENGNERETDDLLRKINSFYEKEIWTNHSPVWSRNVIRPETMFPPGYIQVAGHTPVKAPYWDPRRKILCVDTFSTDPFKNPIGDQRFVFIETTTGEWFYAEDPQEK